MKRSPAKTNKKRKAKGISRSTSIVALIIVILVASGLTYWHFHTRAAKSSITASGSSTANNDINFKPPTAQDRQYNNQHKNDLAQQQSSAPAKTAGGKTAVTPLISSVSKNSVHAYVPGIFEDGGTCTATLTNGSRTITKSSTGFENASYTQCGPIGLSSTDLGTSTWSVTVTYNSVDASGTSQAATLTP